jgi:hypothetical protein
LRRLKLEQERVAVGVGALYECTTVAHLPYDIAGIGYDKSHVPVVAHADIYNHLPPSFIGIASGINAPSRNGNWYAASMPRIAVLHRSFQEALSAF